MVYTQRLKELTHYLSFLRVMVIVWRLREHYQNCCVLDCVTQCSQLAAHLYEQFTGQTDWVCHIGTLMLCVEVVA